MRYEPISSATDRPPRPRAGWVRLAALPHRRELGVLAPTRNPRASVVVSLAVRKQTPLSLALDARQDTLSAGVTRLIAHVAPCVRAVSLVVERSQALGFAPTASLRWIPWGLESSSCVYTSSLTVWVASTADGIGPHEGVTDGLAKISDHGSSLSH